MDNGWLSLTRRREQYGMPDGRSSEEEARQVISDYMTNIAGADSRRLPWLIAHAAETESLYLDKLEERLIVAERFGKRKIEEITAYIQRHEEDFRFLCAVLDMFKKQQMEEFVESFKNYVHSKTPAKKSGSTPPAKKP
jgi:hypothetical protein